MGWGMVGFSVHAKGELRNSFPYVSAANGFKKMKSVFSPSSILFLNMRIFVLLIHRLSKYE